MKVHVYHLKSVVITTCIITIGKICWTINHFEEEQIFEESRYGLKLVIPPLAVPQGEESIKVKLYVVEETPPIPDGYTPVSCFYNVLTTRDFTVPIELHIEHNSSDKELVFLTCKEDTKSFDISPPKELTANTGVLQLTHSSLVALAAFNKPTLIQRSYAMILFYQPIVNSTTQWRVKIVFTQNLGPYLEVISPYMLLFYCMFL